MDGHDAMEALNSPCEVDLHNFKVLLDDVEVQEMLGMLPTKESSQQPQAVVEEGISEQGHGDMEVSDDDEPGKSHITQTSKNKH